MDWKHTMLTNLRKARWNKKGKGIMTILLIWCCISTALLKNINLLSQERFVAVLFDLTLVEAMVDTFYDHKELDEKNKIRIYNNGLVYQLHKTNQVTFEKTYKYYLQYYPHELTVLYNEVEQRLSKLIYTKSNFKK